MSVSADLTATDLKTMNSTINSNDSWGLLSNCSTFASKVWNSVSSTKVSAGTVNTPSNLAKSIKSKFSNTYLTDRSIPSKLAKTLAYHTSSGIKYCNSPTGGGSSSGSSKNTDADPITNKHAVSFSESEPEILLQLDTQNK